MQNLSLSFFSCKFSWYLCKRDLKSSLIISSVSLPFISSLLTLLVCMTRVSLEPGLKEIKLICAVNWIFHSPLFFLLKTVLSN